MMTGGDGSDHLWGEGDNDTFDLLDSTQTADYAFGGAGTDTCASNKRDNLDVLSADIENTQ